MYYFNQRYLGHCTPVPWTSIRPASNGRKPRFTLVFDTSYPLQVVISSSSKVKLKLIASSAWKNEWRSAVFIAKSVELVSLKDTMISQITKQCHLGLSIFLHNLQNNEQYDRIEFKSSQSLELWYRDQTGRSRFLVDYIYVYIYMLLHIPVQESSLSSH